MSTTTDKQLCQNCDGYVHVYEIQCPYCGVELTQSNSGDSQGTLPKQNVSDYESNAFSSYGAMPSPGFELNTQSEITEDTPDEEINNVDTLSPLKSLLLLLPGSFLLVFGLCLALFSVNGELILSFNAKRWAMYLFGSLPLIFFGYRSLFAQKKQPEKLEN